MTHRSDEPLGPDSFGGEDGMPAPSAETLRRQISDDRGRIEAAYKRVAQPAESSATRRGFALDGVLPAPIVNERVVEEAVVASAEREWSLYNRPARPAVGPHHTLTSVMLSNIALNELIERLRRVGFLPSRGVVTRSAKAQGTRTPVEAGTIIWSDLIVMQENISNTQRSDDDTARRHASAMLGARLGGAIALRRIEFFAPYSSESVVDSHTGIALSLLVYRDPTRASEMLRAYVLGGRLID